MSIEAQNCPNCGAPVEHGAPRCKWCGTTFKITDRFMVVERRSGVHTLQKMVIVPDDSRYLRNPEAVNSYVLGEIRHEIADALTAFLRIECEDDPIRMEKRIRGTVRVLEPDYTFERW